MTYNVEVTNIDVNLEQNITEVEILVSFQTGVGVSGGCEVTNENVIAALGFTPQTKSLSFTDTEVLTTDFVADTTYADYGYKAEIAASGVTSADMADVIFAPTESDSDNFASVAATSTDTVTIYAKAIPSGTITIPTILIHKL